MVRSSWLLLHVVYALRLCCAGNAFLGSIPKNSLFFNSPARVNRKPLLLLLLFLSPWGNNLSHFGQMIYYLEGRGFFVVV